MQPTAEQEKRLRHLLHVFLEENKKLNLSSLRAEEDCWEGNILDSLAFLEIPNLDVSKSHIMDVGTGGGFPLLPLVICLPEAELTGLDSTKKKVDAVRRISEELKLEKVSLIAGRAEEVGHDPVHREKYDFVLSRAVADIAVLLEYCSPFAKVGGKIVLWKSLDREEELQKAKSAAEVLACTLVSKFEYSLPTRGRRQLLIFEKTKSTPKEFPRGVGIPGKKPLIPVK